jgi:hypothetical protein
MRREKRCALIRQFAAHFNEICTAMRSVAPDLART